MHSWPLFGINFQGSRKQIAQFFRKVRTYLQVLTLFNLSLTQHRFTKFIPLWTTIWFVCECGEFVDKSSKAKDIVSLGVLVFTYYHIWAQVEVFTLHFSIVISVLPVLLMDECSGGVE